MNDSAALLLEVGTNLDTGSAFVVGELPAEGFEEAYAFAASYLSTASEVIEDAASRIYLAYDPGLRASAESSNRFTSVAGANVRLAESLSKASGRVFGTHDLIIIFGPSMFAYTNKPEAMQITVVNDLSVYFNVAYPVSCSGPLANIMPSFTQVAARILLQGKPGVTMKIGGTGKKGVQDVLKDRAEAAIASSMREKAVKDYGTLDGGAAGMLLTAYPDILVMADAVAEEAIVHLDGMKDGPMPFEVLVLAVHNTIAQAMRNMGFAVMDRAPISLLEKTT